MNLSLNPVILAEFKIELNCIVTLFILGSGRRGQLGDAKLMLICRGKQQMTDYARLQKQVFLKLFLAQ